MIVFRFILSPSPVILSGVTLRVNSAKNPKLEILRRYAPQDDGIRQDSLPVPSFHHSNFLSGLKELSFGLNGRCNDDLSKLKFFNILNTHISHTGSVSAH